MTVLEFIDKYTKANSEKAKEQMLRSHIKRTYCPILEKRTILQIMLDNSVVTTDTGVKYIDMTTSRINYTMALIALYTDLTIDKDPDRTDKDGKPIGRINECYDGLMESGLIGEICKIIGEIEITEFSAINSDIMQNFESSQGSTQALFSRLWAVTSQKIGVAMGVVMENIDRIMPRITEKLK